MEWTIQAIGQIHTACSEKFGLPRQSGLVEELTGEIEIFSPYDRDEAFRELEGFSHIWVISLFHMVDREKWQPMVRPPRLGGNEKVGVFASRSPYHPNSLGLSVFRFLGLRRDGNKLLLEVAGNDLVEGTPIIDIKPYLPYCDSIPGASGAYTETVLRETLPVNFTSAASEACDVLESERYAGLRKLIVGLLAQDPRPAYKKEQEQNEYGMRLYDLNIRFQVRDGKIFVIGIDCAY